MAYISKNISFSPELFAKIEKIRGSMPRSTFLASVLRRALDSIPPPAKKSNKKKTRKEVPA